MEEGKGHLRLGQVGEGVQARGLHAAQDSLSLQDMLWRSCQLQQAL